jgi:hypothetical protein
LRVNRLLLAGLPVDTDNEGNLSVDGIGGQETGTGGVLGVCETDLRVDVEGLNLAARSPDGGGEWDLVVDEVVLGDWAGEVGLGRGLNLLSGEVVGGLLGGSDSLVEGNESTGIDTKDGVLEAGWVVEVDVDLAVLAVLDDRDTWTDRCDVIIEDEGESGLVGRERDTNSSLWASSSTVGDGLDVDLAWVGNNSRGWSWSGDGEASKGKTGSEDGLELHFERLSL